MIDQLKEDYDDMDGPRQSIVYSPVPPFFAWVGVVFAGLITAAVCWASSAVVELKADVAVLVARPVGVSRDEYLRDSSRIDREIQELRDRPGSERSGRK